MGLYNIKLDEEQCDELLNGKEVWYDITDNVNVSLELGEENGANETSQEEGHKCGFCLTEETIKRIRDGGSGLGWTALEGHKVGGGEQVEILLKPDEENGTAASGDNLQ